MFKGLAPVLSGFGIKMLKKMGWNEGQSLGRMGTGVTEPIPMSVKVDRAGGLCPYGMCVCIIMCMCVCARMCMCVCAHVHVCVCVKSIQCSSLL